MDYSYCGEDIQSLQAECLIVALPKSAADSPLFTQLDDTSDGYLSQLIDAGDLDLGLGQCKLLNQIPNSKIPRIAVVGAGDLKELSPQGYVKMLTSAAGVVNQCAAVTAVSTLHRLPVRGRDEAWKIGQAVLKFEHACYLYRATVTPKNAPKKPLQALAFTSALADPSVLTKFQSIASGVTRARELGNLPPNICNPAYLAKTGLEIAALNDSVSAEILEEEALKELGMGALLSVAQGSENRPRLIVLNYQGGSKEDRPHVLVGKGITFDSGGISLKPGAGMDEMKFDMCGAASVLGAFEAAIRMRLAINVVCIVPAVENMPGGKAYRPGDVVTSMSGQTIEVLNTDAEGRLILCDALSYAEKFDPASIIDVATLTGACVIALGNHASGLLSNNDEMADELMAAGETILDRTWRLPLWDEYQCQLDTPFADMSNIGGKEAGTITAACFLSRFTKKQRWSHLDIAGTAWKGGSKTGASGRPVSLLVQYLCDRCG